MLGEASAITSSNVNICLAITLTVRYFYIKNVSAWRIRKLLNKPPLRTKSPFAHLNQENIRRRDTPTIIHEKTSDEFMTSDDVIPKPFLYSNARMNC